MKKEVSLTGRHASTWSISSDELDSFCILLDHGLDTATMASIAFSHADAFLQELEKGISLSEVICDHCTKKNTRILKVLGRHMSFSMAVSAMKRIEKSSSDLENKLAKNAAYPLFLFVFSFFMILFFTGSIMPQMQVYAQDSMIPSLLEGIKVIYFVLFGILFVCMLLFLDVQYAAHPLKLAQRIILKIPMMKMIYTYQFSVLFQTLLEAGLNTREIQEILEQLDYLPALRCIVPQIGQGLQSGIPFLDVLKNLEAFDSRFSFFLASGMQTMSLPPLLELYETQSMYLIEQKMKRLSLGIQIASYVAVGVLVLSVYQVMLMPLNMLTTF